MNTKNRLQRWQVSTILCDRRSKDKSETIRYSSKCTKWRLLSCVLKAAPKGLKPLKNLLKFYSITWRISRINYSSKEISTRWIRRSSRETPKLKGWRISYFIIMKQMNICNVKTRRYKDKSPAWITFNFHKQAISMQVLSINIRKW